MAAQPVHPRAQDQPKSHLGLGSAWNETGNLPTNTIKRGGTRLKLDQNDTKGILPERFKNTHRLRNLRLDGNQLDSIPTKALEPLIYLEALYVSNVTLNRYLDGSSIKDYFLIPTMFESMSLGNYGRDPRGSNRLLDALHE
uniref:Uncharacterized protein n=1 Tax=Timema cristinae TaxID=61476 RepID=A0A7R9CRM7_TIMCR|nr:unnamed protein product [Timema cristinae]